MTPRARDVINMDATQTTIQVYLLGSPNSGKSLLFNAITGEEQLVGNWCGKTTEACSRTMTYNGRAVAFADLPGIYGLGAHTPEERAVQAFLDEHPPDVVLVMLDAINMERSLYLAVQALEIFHRVGAVLTKLDVAKANGVTVDADKLSARLGIPILTGSGAGEVDRRQLFNTIFALRDKPPATPSFAVSYPPAVENYLHRLAASQPGQPLEQRCRALRLLAAGSASDAEELTTDMEIEMASARYQTVQDILAQCVRQSPGRVEAWTDRLDRVALHPYLGVPVMVLVFGVLFYITFAVSRPASVFLSDAFDVFGALVAKGFNLVGVPPVITSLVTDGIIKGVGATMGFVPQIVVFFLFYNALQDSGYIVRVAFLMDRLMRLVGLHGKTFLPIIVGYSCNVNGILASRILRGRDRITAILISTFAPCSARFGVIVFLAGAFFASREAALVMLLVLAVGVLLMSAVALAIRRLLPRTADTTFMMDMPLYQVPHWSVLFAATWKNTKAFLARIKNVIIYASVVVWFLSNFPGGGFEQSYMALIGHAIEPFGALMGLNWQLIVALIMGIAAKETTLSALGIMYNAANDTGSLAVVLPAHITPLAAFTFILVYMIYIPCVATVATIVKETGDWRYGAVSIMGSLTIAVLLGMLVYNIGRLLF